MPNPPPVTGKAQDKLLMDGIEEFLNEGVDERELVAAVTRVHERSISVAFPDGRVVSLVLYGPRGKA